MALFVTTIPVLRLSRKVGTALALRFLGAHFCNAGSVVSAGAAHAHPGPGKAHEWLAYKTVYHVTAQWRVASAQPADFHGDRACAFGRAPGPGVSGLRAQVAGASSAGRVGPVVSLARALGGVALRVRGDHAGGDLDAVAGFRRPLARLVAGGA